MSQGREELADSARKREFLTIGAGSLLQAEAAVARFRRLIYEGAKKAFEDHVGELQLALGMTLDTSQLKINPDQLKMQNQIYDEDFSNSSWGASLCIKNVGTLYSYIWWHYEEGSTPVVDAVVSITPNRREARERMLTAFRKEGLRVREDENEIFIAHRIPPDEFHTFQTTLGELMLGWIDNWKKIGGLRPYLK